MQPTKMRELVSQLLTNARSMKVEWEKTPNQDSYVVNLPDMSIVVERRDGGIFLLRLINGEGSVIETMSEHISGTTRQQLEELHDLARRHVLEIDKHIDKALEYLRRV